MNTRIQVEHPVTEMITDIDLIFEQIRVAAGGELDLAAERRDASAATPSSAASMPRTRSRSAPRPARSCTTTRPAASACASIQAVYQGYTIPPYYDSLVGKLIVHGKTRSECLMRLKRALDEVVVDGIETTLPLFRALVREKDIIDGNYHIHWLEQFLAKGGMES